jgi:hypothetical protein
MESLNPLTAGRENNNQISERSMIMEESLKELYYEADTRKHQQFVARLLIAAAKRMLARAVSHDKSKLKEPERSHYVGPVYALNTEAVPYGSERYKELTARWVQDGITISRSMTIILSFLSPFQSKP